MPGSQPSTLGAARPAAPAHTTPRAKVAGVGVLLPPWVSGGESLRCSELPPWRVLVVLETVVSGRDEDPALGDVPETCTALPRGCGLLRWLGWELLQVTLHAAGANSPCTEVGPKLGPPALLGEAQDSSWGPPFCHSQPGRSGGSCQPA